LKHDCQYHPGDPAKWHCGECQLHFCTRCMPDANAKQRRGLCPKCSKAMRYLGAATEVVPFWHRLGAFFRYPFHTDPLLVIAICTLVPALVPQNLLGMLVWLLLALALMKYTYAVINRTAEGHLKPPPLAEAFSGSGFNIVILQILVFALMGGLVTAAGMLGGPLLLMLTLAFVVLALPASIMVLAMERSVGAAVNPLNLATLIARIGSPYFLLYGYLILLVLASGAAQDFALTHFSDWVSRPLAGFLNSTFTLMLFHMLGYLLFQYQEELGFAADYQDAVEPEDQHHRDRSQRFDADLDMNLKDGNYDRAQTLLLEQLKREPDNSLRIGQLYRLLAARNDIRSLHANHPRIMAWLAAHNNGKALADLLVQLQQADPQFRLQDAELSVTVAGALYRSGHYRLALKLLQDFHKRFADSQALVPAYLLAAQTLANGLGQWEKATAFLSFIQRKCPQHPQHSEIQRFLEQAQERQPLRGPKASFNIAD